MYLDLGVGGFSHFLHPDQLAGGRGIGVVLIEAPQLLREALGHGAPLQRNRPVGLTGRRQCGQPPVGAQDLDRAGLRLELDLGDAGPGGRMARHRHAKSRSQPGVQQVCRGRDPLGRDRRRLHLLLMYVERRGKQRPPRGEPGPGQIGGTGGVLPALVEQGGRPAAGGCRDVGDPALGKLPERVAAGILRRRPGPPHHDRRVGQQQRQHHRLRMLHDRPAEPDQRDLARPAVAGADLRVDHRRTAPGAEDDAQDPRGMLERRLLGRFHGLGHLVLGDHDHERHHHAHGRRAGLAAGPHELGRDGRRRGVGELDHFGVPAEARAQRVVLVG